MEFKIDYLFRNSTLIKMSLIRDNNTIIALQRKIREVEEQLVHYKSHLSDTIEIIQKHCKHSHLKEVDGVYTKCKDCDLSLC